MISKGAGLAERELISRASRERSAVEDTCGIRCDAFSRGVVIRPRDGGASFDRYQVGLKAGAGDRDSSAGRDCRRLRG